MAEAKCVSERARDGSLSSLSLSLSLTHSVSLSLSLSLSLPLSLSLYLCLRAGILCAGIVRDGVQGARGCGRGTL